MCSVLFWDYAVQDRTLMMYGPYLSFKVSNVREGFRQWLMFCERLLFRAVFFLLS
jgi:hypothetical protein